MTYIKKTAVTAVCLLLIAGFTSMTREKQQIPWPVPELYENMKNPVEPTAESLERGREMYDEHCASCHGKTGLGDGIKARTLETFPGDMSGEAYKSQSDGAMFYKSKIGRGEMPSYVDKIDDEDIWHMVNYMKTF